MVEIVDATHVAGDHRIGEWPEFEPERCRRVDAS
jgi:hypothetical protein